MTETEIVVQDIRRELRWSYRDQSTSNLRALASRLIDHKDRQGSVRISVSGEVIPGAAQRGCPLYLRCSMPDLMR